MIGSDRSRPGRACDLALPLAVLLLLSPVVPATASPDPVPVVPATAVPDPVPCDDCWIPEVQTSWQWQLQGRIDTSVDAQMYDVDAFEVGARVVRKLHDKGRAVVCYVSAGSWERVTVQARQSARRA